MNDVRVVKSEKGGRFKVLVNYIQQGVEYSSEELATRQANIIKQMMEV